MARKPMKKKERTTFTFRVTDEEFASMKKMAEKYANGRVSAWARVALTNYVPKRSKLKFAA